jgi:hypothetical protein
VRTSKGPGMAAPENATRKDLKNRATICVVLCCALLVSGYGLMGIRRSRDVLHLGTKGETIGHFEVLCK